MKRFILLAAGITLVFSVNAFAAGGAGKIGYFDIQTAITQSETGKRVIEEMKKEEERLGGALEQKMRAFTAAKEEYDKKKDVMDEKGRGRKEKELTDMYTELQKTRSESSAKFNEQKNTAMAPLIRKVNDIARKIGADEKYDFIFEKGVVYYSGNEKEDLTKRITAELDKSSLK